MTTAEHRPMDTGFTHGHHRAVKCNRIANKLSPFLRLFRKKENDIEKKRD